MPEVPDDMGDVFSLTEMSRTKFPKMCASCHQWRWFQACETLAAEFRDNVLIPIDQKGALYSDLIQGLLCPGGIVNLPDVV